MNQAQFAAYYYCLYLSNCWNCKFKQFRDFFTLQHDPKWTNMGMLLWKKTNIPKRRFLRKQWPTNQTGGPAGAPLFNGEELPSTCPSRPTRCPQRSATNLLSSACLGRMAPSSQATQGITTTLTMSTGEGQLGTFTEDNMDCGETRAASAPNSYLAQSQTSFSRLWLFAPPNLYMSTIVNPFQDVSVGKPLLFLFWAKNDKANSVNSGAASSSYPSRLKTSSARDSPESGTTKGPPVKSEKWLG